MGIYRQYFNKNNTIIKGSTVNTGNNPIAELAYGGRVTRFMMNIDLSTLKEKITNGEFGYGDIKYILRIKSTYEFSLQNHFKDPEFLQLDSNSRPSSFRLELVELPELFDEGAGYDFSLNNARRAEDREFVHGASNWFYRTTTHEWATPGALSNNSYMIAAQLFDKGNEDVFMDISEYVSECIEIGNNSLNFCLKYPDELEAVSGTTESSLGLFTRHTQSFFEPFLEVIYDDVIRDDRNSFALKKANRLYLYVNVNGHPTNLDQLPVCTITCDGSPITPAVTQQSTGVYYVTVGSNVNYTTLKKYYDTWSGLIVNGQALPNVKMNFVPKEPSEYYHIGSEMLHTQRYGLSLSGIKQEEKITQGEIRRINTLVRKPYTVNNYDVIDGLQYRVYVKVGPTQLTIIDWSDVSQANLTNFFMLDTSWMIPNKYYVDIKVKQNGETLLYNDQLVFNIVSRKMM